MIEIRVGRLRFTENESHRTLSMSAEADSGVFYPVGTVVPPADIEWETGAIKDWLVSTFLPKPARAPVLDRETGIEEPAE